MPYWDYDWACRDRSVGWRFAEIFVRTMIGAAWAFVVLFLLGLLVVEYGLVRWSTVAMVAVMLLGFELAHPGLAD